MFIAALADITGSLDQALTEVARVLNLRGRVLPTTLDDVKLVATVLQPDRDVTIRVEGESQIPETGGRIQSVTIEPETVRAFPDSVAAILNAQVVLIGPGSLYTSILPSLLVPGILDALRASAAIKVYVCNVAEQPGETTGLHRRRSYLGVGTAHRPRRVSGRRLERALPNRERRAKYGLCQSRRSHITRCAKDMTFVRMI
ncbi:MAG: YvcK family protein [Chloroflexi bacterium]|nr:YvcK family protein [Chloroflexota bacterium]